ncbi:MAG: cyclic nucleotide-binding domain-containing protein [Gammaproteobacteria bacterium]|nr:cyclic nucleotide-binding domain-containing protein [Gammaproteobacteria bacterium]
MIEILRQIMDDPVFVEHVDWERRQFDSNEIILREGDEGRSLFVIEAGELRVSGHVELEGHRHLQPGICDLGPGDLFGELCLFQPRPRSASVKAVTRGTLIEIKGESLNRYLDAHPEQGYGLIKKLYSTLINRLSQANQRVENLLAWGLKAHGIEKHL